MAEKRTFETATAGGEAAPAPESHEPPAKRAEPTAPAAANGKPAAAAAAAVGNGKALSAEEQLLNQRIELLVNTPTPPYTKPLNYVQPSPALIAWGRDLLEQLPDYFTNVNLQELAASAQIPKMGSSSLLWVNVTPSASQRFEEVTVVLPPLPVRFVRLMVYGNRWADDQNGKFSAKTLDLMKYQASLYGYCWSDKQDPQNAAWEHNFSKLLEFIDELSKVLKHRIWDTSSPEVRRLLLDKQLGIVNTERAAKKAMIEGLDEALLQDSGIADVAEYKRKQMAALDVAPADEQLRDRFLEKGLSNPVAQDMKDKVPMANTHHIKVGGNVFRAVYGTKGVERYRSRDECLTEELQRLALRYTGKDGQVAGGFHYNPIQVFTPMTRWRAPEPDPHRSRALLVDRSVVAMRVTIRVSASAKQLNEKGQLHLELAPRAIWLFKRPEGGACDSNPFATAVCPEDEPAAVAGAAGADAGASQQ